MRRKSPPKWKLCVPRVHSTLSLRALVWARFRFLLPSPNPAKPLLANDREGGVAEPGETAVGKRQGGRSPEVGVLVVSGDTQLRRQVDLVRKERRADLAVAAEVITQRVNQVRGDVIRVIRIRRNGALVVAAVERKNVGVLAVGAL